MSHQLQLSLNIVQTTKRWSISLLTWAHMWIASNYAVHDVQLYIKLRYRGMLTSIMILILVSRDLNILLRKSDNRSKQVFVQSRASVSAPDGTATRKFFGNHQNKFWNNFRQIQAQSTKSDIRCVKQIINKRNPCTNSTGFWSEFSRIQRIQNSVEYQQNLQYACIQLRKFDVVLEKGQFHLTLRIVLCRKRLFTFINFANLGRRSRNTQR